MASGALFIGWGPVVRGREQQALRVFNEVMQYYGRLQQQGEIESFEPVILEPHGGDLNGFVLIRGDRDKLNHLRTNDEFIHNVNRASLYVDNVGVVGAYTGEALDHLFADFHQVIGELAGGGG
jgi:hypothetical protein